MVTHVNCVKECKPFEIQFLHVVLHIDGDIRLSGCRSTSLIVIGWNVLSKADQVGQAVPRYLDIGYMTMH